MKNRQKYMNENFLKICVESSISVAHALSVYKGKCNQIHGHNYKLRVCINGNVNNDPKIHTCGMLMDYKELKSIVKQNITDKFDHSLILSDNTFPEVKEVLQKYYSNIKIVDFEPTCENLVLEFVKRIEKVLPDGIGLVNLKLSETETSYSEWPG